MLTVLGGLAEFERELIRARTGEGRARAKARGVRLGRRPKLTPHQQWIRSSKHIWRRPIGAIRVRTERGTVRLELVQGAVGVPWGDGRSDFIRDCNTRKVRDTCVARTSPPRPLVTA